MFKKVHMPSLGGALLIVVVIVVGYHFFHSATAHSASGSA